MGEKVHYQKNLGGTSEQEFFGWDRSSWVASGKGSRQYSLLLYFTDSSGVLRVNDLHLEETFEQCYSLHKGSEKAHILFCGTRRENA